LLEQVFFGESEWSFMFRYIILALTLLYKLKIYERFVRNSKADSKVRKYLQETELYKLKVKMKTPN